MEDSTAEILVLLWGVAQVIMVIVVIAVAVTLAKREMRESTEDETINNGK